MSHDDRLELLVEGALHTTLLADRQGTILAVNGEAERLFGYARQELIGAPVERLLPEPLRSAHRRLREDYGRTPSPRRMGAGRDLYGLRKDGSRVPIEIGLNPLKEDGDLVILATITDITERKRMDTERDLLIRELSHRVKNSLALAFAIAKHTWRTVETPDAFLDAYAERLQALSRGNDDSLNLTRRDADLADLVQREIEAVGAGGRVAVAGPAVVVSRDQAGPLALVIHEMATNAYKYGALSEPAGSVRLEWSCEADGGAQCIHVVWKEIGGPTVSVPRRRGFGHRMIEAAIPDARVDIVFEPDGLRYELVLPMAASAAAAGAGSSGTARKAG